jgi:2-iminobutanoate/2-iminopropanoate deaminase
MTQSSAINTPGAPKAIGPYSQGIEAGSGKLVFCSGQIGLDPATQSLVSGGIEPETRRVMENLKAVLEAAGLSLANVVKTTIYLADFNDYGKVNAIYGEYWKSGPAPARATVGVSALPRGAKVEIDAIAVATR